MPWLRRGLYALVAATVLALLVYGFLPEPAPAEFATVARGTLHVAVEAEAVTRVRDRFVIHAPLAAHMERLPFKVGAEVTAGQRLTRLRGLRPLLDARAVEQAQAAILAAKASVQQAEAALDGAQADSAYAASEHARARKLFASKLIAQEAADAAATRAKTAAAALRSATFAVEAARFQLRVAQAALAADDEDEELELHAPVAGRILRVWRESAGTVAPGEPLLEIGDPAAIEIVADLLSQDAVRVRPDMRVVIERWGGPPLSGRVREIEPAGFTRISALGVEEQRVNVLIDFADDAASHFLGDAFRVEVRVLLVEMDDVLRVPLSAVFRTAAGEAVFVAERGTAQLRPVELGARSGIEAEVRAGLVEGEQVIIHPSDQIRDRAAVRARQP